MGGGGDRLLHLLRGFAAVGGLRLLDFILGTAATSATSVAAVASVAAVIVTATVTTEAATTSVLLRLLTGLLDEALVVLAGVLVVIVIIAAGTLLTVGGPWLPVAATATPIVGVALTLALVLLWLLGLVGLVLVFLHRLRFLILDLLSNGWDLLGWLLVLFLFWFLLILDDGGGGLDGLRLLLNVLRKVLELTLNHLMKVVPAGATITDLTVGLAV